MVTPRVGGCVAGSYLVDGPGPLADTVAAAEVQILDDVLDAYS